MLKSAKPSNFNFLTNQRPATEILTNGITWREIHFGFWTNQRTIKSLLASLSHSKKDPDPKRMATTGNGV